MLDRRIKIRHLLALTEIARRGALKPAAERLGLTQPAISKTLSELETILGTRLMDRDRGGIRLTGAGEAFVPFAESGLAALNHGFQALEGVRTGAARLSIGVLPSVAAKLLPEAVRRFRKIAPDTLLQIEDGPHDTMVEQLRAGQLDLIIGRLGPPDTMSGLSFTQLYGEHVAVVAVPGHPLLSQGFAALGQHLVIYPPRRAAIRPLVDRLLIARGVGMPENRIETVTAAFARPLVTGPERAVWLISHGVVADDLATGRLAALAVDGALTAGPVGIIARSEEDPQPAARLMRRAVIEAAATLG